MLSSATEQSRRFNSEISNLKCRFNKKISHKIKFYFLNKFEISKLQYEIHIKTQQGKVTQIYRRRKCATSPVHNSLKNNRFLNTGKKSLKRIKSFLTTMPPIWKNER
jgi:hypothetical protein